MRKAVFTMVVTIAVLLMLLPTIGSSANTPVKLVFNCGNQSPDKIKIWVNKFNQTHADIQVELASSTVNIEDQLRVMIAGNKLPDLMIGAAGWALAYGGQNGVLLNLTPYIEEGLDKKRYMGDWWVSSTVDNGVYQGFWGFNERTLYLNTDMVEQAGLNSARPPQNWQEFVNWGKVLTRRQSDGTTSVWGFDSTLPMAGGVDTWIWMWLNDGNVFRDENTKLYPGAFNVDHPNSIQAVEFLSSLVNDYSIAAAPGVKGISFIDGNSAMGWETQGLDLRMMNLKTFTYKTTPPPVGVGKTGGRFSGAGASIVAFRNSKYPDEAREFIRWFAFENGAEIAIDTNLLPTDLKAWQTNAYWRNTRWQAYIQSYERLTPRWVLKEGWQAGQWLPVLQKAVLSVIRREQAANIALPEANRQLNSMLNDVLASIK